jgi:hypothetical protein
MAATVTGAMESRCFFFVLHYFFLCFFFAVLNFSLSCSVAVCAFLRFPPLDFWQTCRMHHYSVKTIINRSDSASNLMPHALAPQGPCTISLKGLITSSEINTCNSTNMCMHAEMHA